MSDMTPGHVVTLTPLVRRILCPNPSVFTGPGTNTYLVGHGDVAVIDPGPDHAEHLDRIAEATGGRIRWILATHTHSDHAPGVASLRDRIGGDVEVVGFGPRDGFAPTVSAGDGYRIETGEMSIRAIHTPGHASNHLCYLLEGERVLFSGDHIMNGSTVVISPPDGDMAAYLQALRAVRQLDLASIAPGHGDLIEDPVAKIDEYISHRLQREKTVLDALRAAGGDTTVDELVRAVYTDVAPGLHSIARFSLWAHLRKLAADGLAQSADPNDVKAAWVAA